MSPCRGGLVLKLVSNCIFCRHLFEEGFLDLMHFVYPSVLQYVQIFKRLMLHIDSFLLATSTPCGF